MANLANIDRRWIFLAVFISVLVPLLVGFHLPVKASPNVRAIYTSIDALDAKAGDTVLMSFDFGPSTLTELQPMAKAVLRHCFRKKLKVVGVTLLPEGVGIAETILSDVAAEFGATYGEDYIFLGYKAGNEVLILNMGEELRAAFSTDVRGTPLDDLTVTRPLRSLGDMAYVLDISAGYPGVEEWIQYGQERYRFKLGAGCTAVMAPDFFPFLQSGQLDGLLGGLAGAAEYETLIGQPDAAVSGMRPQSVGHVVIILFILFGNVAYFASRRGGGS